MRKVGPGIWQDNWKRKKWETHTVGREIWRGKLKKQENEKSPLENLKNDKITEKREK